MTVDDLHALLSRFAFRFASEADLQDGIETVLRDAGIAYERERILTKRDRIDFMVGGVGVEVKIAGGQAEVLRQLARYAGRVEVASLLLVTSRVQLGNMPPDICGKRLRVLSLRTGIA